MIIQSQPPLDGQKRHLTKPSQLWHLSSAATMEGVVFNQGNMATILVSLHNLYTKILPHVGDPQDTVSVHPLSVGTV